MTEYHPVDRPGHLDIDAVSAFIDRDLGPDDLATLEIHLRQCPHCHREVLEIRATVMLLSGLPQYMPRRSFCLGHEHARAARRRGRGTGAHSWSNTGFSAGYPATAITADRGRGAGWLPSLQVAAMVIGAMLLLVTSSDLIGMPPQPAAWLAEPEAPRVENFAPPAPTIAPPQSPPPAADTAVAPEQAAPASESGSSFGIIASESDGTVGGDSASQEMLADTQEQARTAPAFATSAAIAAVTQEVPTAAAAPAGGPETASGAEAPAASGEQPPRLRLVQIALALALAWLLVSIVGLRWVRGLR
jgi:hypothetical protein